MRTRSTLGWSQSKIFLAPLYAGQKAKSTWVVCYTLT